MNIWIMRHGEASFNALNDADRYLTIKGIKNVKSQGEWLGKYLTAQNIRLDKIIVSPYLRTQQTLENLIEGMQAVDFSQHFATITEIWEEVTPIGSPYTVENYLNFLHSEGANNILIISHLPLVFDLAQILSSHNENIQFPTAAIAEIHWNGKRGEVAQLKYI